METSILSSTKNILGISTDDTTFDLDIITQINAAFTTLNDLGIGPDEGYMIEDATPEWTDYISDDNLMLNSVKTYAFLKTKMYFDPPTNSYLVEATQKQINELEWRLNVRHEHTGWVNPLLNQENINGQC